MNTSILISTDGSKFSEGAVREAINMAKACKGKLFALSVVEVNQELMALGPNIIEEKIKDAKKVLEEVKKKASREKVECETIVREGEETYQLILQEAEKHNAGTIVMGRRGRKGIMRLLMGSATARVIGHASCEVLVVPKDAHIHWRNIVLATDGSSFSEAAAEEAIQIIKLCGPACTLNVIAVTRPSATPERIFIAEEAIRRITKRAQKEKISISSSLMKGKPHESIHESIIAYAEDKDADVIIMGSHGRTGIQKLLMGSVAERVVGHMDRAVLIVK